MVGCIWNVTAVKSDTSFLDFIETFFRLKKRQQLSKTLTSMATVKFYIDTPELTGKEAASLM